MKRKLNTAEDVNPRRRVAGQHVPEDRVRERVIVNRLEYVAPAQSIGGNEVRHAQVRENAESESRRRRDP